MRLPASRSRPAPDPTRRALLARLPAVAGVLTGAGLAAGCGSLRPAARPHGNRQTVRLVFQPVATLPFTQLAPVFRNVLAGFETSHPGITVDVVPPAGTASNLAAITAGTGADIIYDFHFAPYAQQGLLLPLDAFLRQDNIPTDRWSATQMRVYRTPQGLCALPCFFGTMVYAANLDDFDRAGLAYPDPAWTYTDFSGLARDLTRVRNGSRRYGAEVAWYAASTNDGESAWLFRAFGGRFIDPAGTGLEIDSPPGLAAGRWMYEELLWPGIATPRQPGRTSLRFGDGQASMVAIGNWDVARVVLAAQSLSKWNFYPFPRFPHGRTTFGTDDFYGINAGTRHVREAWALLRWLCAEPAWQTAMIRTQLLSPSLVSLWPLWERSVRSIAPVLHDKGVEWFARAATGGEAVAPAYFRNQDAPTQALIGAAFGRLLARQTTVAREFARLQTQVDALQAAAAQQGPAPTVAQQRAARDRQMQRLATMFTAGQS